MYCMCLSFLANAVNPREPALSALMEHLKTNIASKKSKNVDILFQAQEVGKVRPRSQALSLGKCSLLVFRFCYQCIIM
jgi:hypothetical protein